MATLYRQQLTRAELAVIAEAWAEDFADVPDERFVSASKEYRKRYGFFPAGSKAMLEICDDLREAELEMRRRMLRALPCEETPVDGETTRKIIAMCQRVIDARTRQ